MCFKVDIWVVLTLDKVLRKRELHVGGTLECTALTGRIITFGSSGWDLVGCCFLIGLEIPVPGCRFCMGMSHTREPSATED